MQIFGINFTTKKELKAELAKMKAAFPLTIGQVVYDVALKNEKGRYTKTHPSKEHCEIIEVTVDEKNYFNLVERIKREDVFVEREDAEIYLEFLCM